MFKRTAINLAIIAGLALALSGCGMFGGDKEPGGPGNTAASLGADGTFNYRSGKDFMLIRGKFTRPDGMSGEFEAQGVDATTAMRIQAEAAKAQAESIKALLEKLLPLLQGAAAGGT